MDANVLLKRIRDLQSQLRNGRGNDPDAYGDITFRIADAVQELDDCLSRGGRLPEAWQPQESALP